MYINLNILSGDTSDSSLSSQGKQPGQSLTGDAGPIRAPAPMWRCSKIMHMQRELHPTILNSLEGIVDQVFYCNTTRGGGIFVFEASKYEGETLIREILSYVKKSLFSF